MHHLFLHNQLLAATVFSRHASFDFKFELTHATFGCRCISTTCLLCFQVYVHRQHLASGVQKSFGFAYVGLDCFQSSPTGVRYVCLLHVAGIHSDFAAVGLALLDLAKGHALRLLLLWQMLLLVRLILSGPGLGEFICGLMAVVSQPMGHVVHSIGWCAYIVSQTCVLLFSLGCVRTL